MNLKDLTLQELEEWVKSQRLERYRASQLAYWLYKKPVSSFMDMTNLPKALRAELEESLELWSLEEISRMESKDGTVKILFKTKDNDHVESVIIPDGERLTLCISTQIGCRMGCKFCLTGHQGFRRNLRPSEILDQILIIKKQGIRLTNIVVMGMGEPLDNFENTTKALSVITSDKGLGFSYRRVTVSTVGLLPQLEKLLSENPKVSLSISLNAPNPEKRAAIMPVEKKHPITRILELLKKHQKRRKLFTMEYVLLKDFNDSKEDALELAKLLKGLKCKINLIPFNPWPGCGFERPERERILEFQEILINRGFSVFIRKSKGADILAACGQLRWKVTSILS